MDNNLLAEIQNEISIVGFDKLKEVHFGAGSNSSSESSENDTLDEEYYRNQPPAHNYESIKDHVVKVSQKSHNLQNKKPYDRTKVYRRRKERHKEWNSQRSGIEAQTHWRHENVSSRYYAQPTSNHNYGSYNNFSTDLFSTWRSDLSIRQNRLESANGSAPLRTPLQQTQLYNWKDCPSNFASPVPPYSRVLPDASKESTLRTSMAIPSSKTSKSSSNAMRPDPLKQCKVSDSYDGSNQSKLKPAIQITTQSSKLHEFTDNSSRYYAQPMSIQNYGSYNSSSNDQFCTWRPDSSIRQKALESTDGRSPFRTPLQQAQVNNLPDGSKENTLKSSIAVSSSKTSKSSSNAMRPDPPNHGEVSDSQNGSTPSKLMSAMQNTTQSNNGHNFTGNFPHSPNHPEKMTNMKGSAPVGPFNNQISSPGVILDRQILAANQLHIGYGQRNMGSNHVIGNTLNIQKQQHRERCPPNSDNNRGSHTSKRFSDDFSDLTYVQEKQKMVEKMISDTTPTVGVKKLARGTNYDITTEEKAKEERESRKGASSYTAKTRGKNGNSFDSKTGLAPTSSSTTDKSTVVKHSVGRQVSQNIKEVRSDIHERPYMEQPYPTPTPEAFLKYIESRLAQSESCGTKTSLSPSVSSVSTNIVQVRDQYVGNKASQDIKDLSRVLGDTRKSFHGNSSFSKVFREASPRHRAPIIIQDEVTCRTGATSERPVHTETMGVSNYNNEAKEAAEIGVMSWICRIFCCAKDIPYETH